MQDGVRDRGMQKWKGLMLTEHLIELKNWMDKEHYIERPELSEWDLQAIQEGTELAYKMKVSSPRKDLEGWKDYDTWWYYRRP